MQRMWILAGVLLALALWLGAGVRAPRAAEPTDAHKLEIVYRMAADYRGEFPAVAEMPVTEAMERATGGDVVFVDVREPAEMKVSMLPGAVSDKDFLLERGRYDQKTVVVYCTIGYRSGLFAQTLSLQGTRVVNLTGGLLAWVLEGGKVFDAHGETHRIHVYGKKWNYLPAGYEAVSFSFWHDLFNR